MTVLNLKITLTRDPPNYDESQEQNQDPVSTPSEKKLAKSPRKWNSRLDDFGYVRRPAPARRVLYDPGNREFSESLFRKSCSGKRGNGAGGGSHKRSDVARLEKDGISSHCHN
jgi:hypothetical protein